MFQTSITQGSHTCFTNAGACSRSLPIGSANTSYLNVAAKSALIACAWALAVAVPAAAQNFPAKAMRVVSSAGAGSGSDALLRQVSAQMARDLKQDISVDNKPSAGSASSASDVLNAAPDGHSLLAADNGAMAFTAALYKKPPFDPAALAPIGVMARAPVLLVSHPGAGFKHVRDMLEKAKSQPTKLAYASPPAGSLFHVTMELLKNRAAVPFVRVPFGSDAAALKDLLGGQVDLAAIDLPSAMPHIRSGKLQVLATFSAKRTNAAPDAPALAELGFKDIDAYIWQSLAVPAATPKEIQVRLSTSMQTALGSNAVRKAATDNGWEILASDPSLMIALIAADARIWQRLIKEIGVTLD